MPVLNIRNVFYTSFYTPIILSIFSVGTPITLSIFAAG
ncbi:hypothetical protein LCGC14_3169530, partial [marine sediment metagenome]